MILFFSPVFNLLSKSEKQAKLVFWGVELVPAVDKNKSLQVSGDFHAKLLNYIKHYIDAAIAEMEGSQQPEDKPEPTNSYTEPVAIKIEGDRLDNFTEILDSNTSGLDFKRAGNKVIVGIFGKEVYGVYGLKDSEIFMEYRLDSYFKSLNIDFDEILDGTGEVILITDSCTKQESTELDKQAEQARKDIFPEPINLESPYSSKEEIEQLEKAYSEKFDTDCNENPETSLAVEVSASENPLSFQKPESEQIFDELQTESLKDRMLGCGNKAELEAFKAEIGEAKVAEIWKSLTIVEKNLIKCITKTEKKPPATLGYQFTWTDKKDGGKHEAIYLGFYLYGEPIKSDDRRVVLVDNLPIEVFKSDLKPVPIKKQRKLSEVEIKKLDAIISNPEPDVAPTATEIAANTFTGLAPSPKSQNGSTNGSQPESEPSKPSAGKQTELNLKANSVPEPKKVETVPTPLLETIAAEIKKVNPSLTFTYDSNEKSTFLEIFHSDSKIGTFEDDGNSLWTINCKTMTHYGFTEEMIDAMAELELPKS